jgi:hypothetical protein
MGSAGCEVDEGVELAKAAEALQSLRVFGRLPVTGVRGGTEAGVRKPFTEGDLRRDMRQRQLTLLESIDKRFCCFQVGRVEALGKASVNRLKQRKRLSGTALIS